MAEPTDLSPTAGQGAPAEPRRTAPNGTGAILGWLRRAARQRRLRQGFFDSSFAIDPAWDMLIELAIARLEGRSVTANRLIEDIAGANLRWVRVLVEKGYCETDDAAAGSSAPIRFTARGWNEMRRYVQAAADAGGSVA
jgi:hypothetical protein